MTWLVIVLLAVLAVALYPVVRDFLRKRRETVPAYVEGLRLALEGSTDEAIARLRDAVNADSDNVDAYVRLGHLFMQKGDIDRALRIHENLSLRRNLSPADERKVFKALVHDYIRTDRKVKAIAILEELVHQDKSDVHSRQSLLELYISTGTWDKCEELLREFGRNPEDKTAAARLYVRLGQAFAREKPDRAEGCFEAALRLDPGLVDALVALGDLRMQQGNAEAALKSWNQVLDVAPAQNALVRGRLERAYFEAGRFEDVTHLYEKLLRKVPSDAGLAVALADIYQKKEDLPAAVRLLERCCRAPESGAAPRIALARLYLARNDTARCAQMLGEAMTALQGAKSGR